MKKYLNKKSIFVENFKEPKISTILVWNTCNIEQGIGVFIYFKR